MHAAAAYRRNGGDPRRASHTTPAGTGETTSTNRRHIASRVRLVELWIFPAKPPCCASAEIALSAAPPATSAAPARAPASRARRSEALGGGHQRGVRRRLSDAAADPPATNRAARAGLARACRAAPVDAAATNVRDCLRTSEDANLSDATRRRRGAADFVFFFFVKASSVPGLKTSGCGFAEGGVAERVGVASTGPEPWSPRAPPDASPRPPRASPDASASVARSSGPSTARSASAASRRLSISSSDKLAKSSSSISSSLTAASLPPGAGRLLAPGILDPPWPMIARRRTIRPSAARPAVRSRRRDPPPSRNALGTNTETSKRFVSGDR